MPRIGYFVWARLPLSVTTCNDLPLLRLVGYSASPSNTPEYVKREVKYVTAAHGGYGAFREFVEKLLSDNGVLEKTVGKFL